MIIHSPIISGSLVFAPNATFTLPPGGIYSGSFSGSYQGSSFSGGTFTGNGSGLTFGGTGIVSGSSQVVSILSSLNTYTGSNDTTNTTQNSRLNQLSTYTGSNDTTNTTQNSRLTSLETASGSAITRLNLLEVETTNLEAFTSSINTTIKTRLNVETVVSGSSQVVGILTSLNTYTASNDTTNTTQTSRLNQLSTYTGSNDTTNTTQNSRLTSLETASGSAITRLNLLEVETANLETFTSSINTTIKTRLNAETVISGSSQVVYTSISSIPTGIVSGSSQITPLLPSGVVSGSSQVNADTITNFDTNVKDKLNTDLVVSGSTSDVKTFLSLQNVTNESKATMFTSPTFTGTPEAPTAAANTNSTQIATTAYVQQELTDLIGGANAAFDTLIEISASLASGDSTLNTLVDGKLAKASNLSDLTNTSTARTNLGVAIGTDVQAYNATLAAVAGGTYSGDDSITTIGTVTAGSVTAILPTGVVSGSSQIVGSSITTNTITIGSTSTALGGTSTTLAGLTSVSSTGFTGALTGNASTATTLQTARTINGTSFNGSANITIPNLVSGSSQITAGSTTGFATSVKTQLDANTVVSGSAQINVASTTGDIALGTRTSGNYVGTITAGNGIVSSGATTGEGIAHTISAGGGVVSGSSQISHDSTTGYSANRHIDHTSITLTAGDGLTGGGTIADSRTFNVVGTTNRISVSADAVDIASTYVGQTSITTLGTIGTGTWQGSVIASAYLDADTAHLSDTQTFTGAKTFSSAVNITNSTASTTITTGALIVTGGVGVSGALNVGGDVVAYASSDKRLKDNIKNIENPIQKVQKLNGVTWDWNSNADELQQSLPNVGVIAQEVEEVLPQLVHNRDNGFKGVDYAKLTGLLIEAIKEQQKQIDELKSKLV
jgi:hypothetical protein